MEAGKAWVEGSGKMRKKKEGRKKAAGVLLTRLDQTNAFNRKVKIQNSNAKSSWKTKAQKKRSSFKKWVAAEPKRCQSGLPSYTGALEPNSFAGQGTQGRETLSLNFALWISFGIPRAPFQSDKVK